LKRRKVLTYGKVVGVLQLVDCVFGLFWGTIGMNVFEWAVKLLGRSDIVPPKFDTASLIALLVPLLGLGVYRTTEKIKGTK
jgi:hypothetical protein